MFVNILHFQTIFSAALDTPCCRQALSVALSDGGQAQRTGTVRLVVQAAI